MPTKSQVIMIFYSMHCTSFQLSVNIRDNWDKYNHGLTTPIKSIPIKAICDDTYMACPCSEYSSHTVFHWLAKSPSSHSTSWDQAIQPSFMKRKFQNIGAPLSSLVEWLFDVSSHHIAHLGIKRYSHLSWKESFKIYVHCCPL